MNKKDLIAKVSEEAGISKNDAAKAVDSVFNSISNALAAGDKVQLLGFGTFEVKHRNARTGFNPRTKEKVEVPACNFPTFKPGKTLKEKV